MFSRGVLRSMSKSRGVGVQVHVEGGQVGMYGIEERARLGVDETVLVGWRRGIRWWTGAAVVGILRERRESAGSRQFAGGIAERRQLDG